MEDDSNEFEIPVASSACDIQPYMFEPTDVGQADQASSESSSSEEEEASAQGTETQRLHDTEWCDCGGCHVMETAAECVCWHEFDVMEEKRTDHDCITMHKGFKANCLNRDVLEVSLLEYIHYEGPLDDNVPMNETYRHIAYRRFVRWVWHRLGKNIRKILPACVVTRIRKEFPSESYKGYRDVVL